MKKGFLPILIAILVALIIGGGAIYFMQKNVSMKLYRNDTYGFEFQYPDGLTVQENGGFNSSFVVLDNKKLFPDILNIIICPFDCGEYPEDKAATTNAIDTVVAKYPAKKSVMDQEVIVYFSKTQNPFLGGEGKDYSPGRITAFVGGGNRNLNTFEKILSTLKFIKPLSISPENSNLPIISSVSPSAVPLLSGFVISGSNFEPLGAYVGNGWLTHSHVLVKIADRNGKTGILWEGGSQGGNTSTANQIIIGGIPRQICVLSELAVGGCPPEDEMPVELGNYSLTVAVDGRGTSDPVPLTVIQGMQ